MIGERAAVSASGPPAPLNAFWSTPTVRHFFAGTQDTPSSSSDGAVTAANAAH
jgi:hypothetical protein